MVVVEVVRVVVVVVLIVVVVGTVVVVVVVVVALVGDPFDHSRKKQKQEWNSELNAVKKKNISTSHLYPHNLLSVYRTPNSARTITLLCVT